MLNIYIYFSFLIFFLFYPALLCSSRIKISKTNESLYYSHQITNPRNDARQKVENKKRCHRIRRGKPWNMERRLSSTLPYFFPSRGASLAWCSRGNDSNLQRQITRARIFYTRNHPRHTSSPYRDQPNWLSGSGSRGRRDARSAASVSIGPTSPRRRFMKHDSAADTRVRKRLPDARLNPPAEIFPRFPRISLSAHGPVTKRFPMKHVFIVPLSFAMRHLLNVCLRQCVFFREGPPLSLSLSLFCCILCTLFINIS